MCAGAPRLAGSARHCCQAPGTLVRSKPARAGSCQARDPFTRPRAPAGAQLSTSAAKTPRLVRRFSPMVRVHARVETAAEGRTQFKLLCALTESRSRLGVGQPIISHLTASTQEEFISGSSSPRDGPGAIPKYQESLHALSISSPCAEHRTYASDPASWSTTTCPALELEPAM